MPDAGGWGWGDLGELGMAAGCAESTVPHRRGTTHTHTHTRYKMAQGKNKHNPWKRQSPLGHGMLLQKWLRNPFPPSLRTSYAVFRFLSNVVLTVKQGNTGSEKRLPILACICFAWNAVIIPRCASPSSLWPWEAVLFSFP